MLSWQQNDDMISSSFHTSCIFMVTFLVHWNEAFSGKWFLVSSSFPPQGLIRKIRSSLNFKPLQYMLIELFRQTCKHPAPSETVSWLNLWPPCYRDPRPDLHLTVRRAMSANNNNMGIMFTPQKCKGHSKISRGCKQILRLWTLDLQKVRRRPRHREQQVTGV